MAESRLEPELVKFLQMHIPSVEQLEVLLLVSSSPEHWWTVRAVNDLLRSSEESIRSRLRELCDQKFLDRAPADESYRLKEDPDLQELMERLKVAYKEFRVRVIEAIYGPKTTPILEFSRAFDFKKKDK